MNEAETRAELIDPQLRASGWGVVEGSKILRERHIPSGRIQTGGRGKPLITDYILVYKNRQLAVVDAKSNERPVGEGVGQAKNSAAKLELAFAYAANGKEIYPIDMRGQEGALVQFPTPDELWSRSFAETPRNSWSYSFDRVPYEDVDGSKQSRYYQEIAANNVMAAIARGQPRILLTLATGTGKTFIAFQIVWKLFHMRWNLGREATRRPRVLFLADRNILADQAFNAFNAFPEDALVRIKPGDIRKQGRVPTNGSIFFTIFQTFMSGPGDTPTPGVPQTPNATLTLQAAYGDIDQQFKHLLKSSIAFNKPEHMQQDESANVELILNPSLSEAQLATQFAGQAGFATSTSEPGKLVAPDGSSLTIETSQIEITPRMKAVLLADDPEAFTITAMHDSAEQIISSSQTTTWRWAVTAKKQGPQTLELVIYRLIQYQGQDHWHEVESYKANIQVEVAPLQILETWDWKWIAGALLIPFAAAVWGWLRNRKKNGSGDRKASRRSASKRPE